MTTPVSNRGDPERSTTGSQSARAGSRVRARRDLVVDGYQVCAGDVGIVTHVGDGLRVQFTDELVTLLPADIEPQPQRFPRITLSGVDERTDMEALDHLAFRHPVEIAILYTVATDGRNRYPSAAWAIGAASRLRAPLAIHVCGSRARLQLLGMDRATELHALLPHAQRIQINGTVTAEEIAAAITLHPLHQIITQHQPANAAVANADLGPRHALLLDGSAGSGRLPDTWSHPGCSKPVGFAGGLGPDTLADQLPRIALEARGAWWVDMEQRLRSPDDWFDLARARASVELFGSWLAATRGIPENGT